MSRLPSQFGKNDVALIAGEVRMLRILGDGGQPFADCRDDVDLLERQSGLRSLRARGWVEDRQLTEQGRFALAEVGCG